MGETIVYAIKVALAVAAGLAFFSALLAITSFIGSITANSVFNEIISLVAVYLPFNVAVPFNTFIGFVSGVLAFLGARKAYQMLSEMHKSS